MTKEEKENLAIEIAETEVILQNATSEEDKKNAAQKIFKLSDKIESLDDLFEIDEIILNYLKKKVDN
jgi:transcriptional/translational regulatory protein YebC/TACO1